MANIEFNDFTSILIPVFAFLICYLIGRLKARVPNIKANKLNNEEVNSESNN